MPKLEWLKTFELRVPEIDCDHRAMFELMKAIQDAAGERRTQRLLDRLVVFLESHFEREELLLEGWGYREVKRHREYHAALLSTVKDAVDEIQTGKASERFCEDLVSFLVDEVIGGDMKLKSFLENAGLTLPKVPC